MKKIAVVGSTNVDTTIYVSTFPKPGETTVSIRKETVVGGKGFNQAVAIKKSGVDVDFFCTIGNDYFANLVIKAIDNNNIISHIDYSEAHTGSAFITIDKTGQNMIVLDGGANNNFQPSYLNDDSILDKYDIILLQNEIPQIVNERIIKKYGSSKVIIYNPAPSRKVSKEILKKVKYLITNEIEIQDITRTNDLSTAFDVVKDFGLSNVVVTLGNKGAMYLGENLSLFVPTYHVEAIDAVAAGDTFIGYFVYGLANDLEVKECLKIANAAGAISVTKKGASSSIPTLEEVKKFLNRPM